MEDTNSDLHFSRINFTTIVTSFYTSYTVITAQNTINLFNFVMKHHPGFVLILVPIYFFTLFLVLTFIVAMMTYFYVKLARRGIKNLKNYSSFKKVFYYFKDSNGIVDYRSLESFIDEFFKGPKKIDFKLYENIARERHSVEHNFREKLKVLSHNTKHHKDFMSVKKRPAYKIATVFIDTLLAISPILVCNFPAKGLNTLWYFWLIILSALSVVDPFLSLIFNGHKITGTRRKTYVFKIMVSFFIVVVCLILPIQGSKPGMTLEQSNDVLFIIFSIFCFMKLITFVDEVLMRNKIIYSIVGLAHQTVPFLIKMLVIYLIMLTLYVIIGRFLYAGRINSAEIAKYEHEFGYTLRSGYRYFHFNDTFSSYLTLFVIVLQNNWVYVVEMMYFVRPGIATTAFVVSFNLFVAFTCTALILGVIARLIILYFEGDFDDIKQNMNNDAYTDIVSKSEVADETDD